MTSPLTNIAGVYEMTVRRMCFDTGFQPEIVKKILTRFQKSKKAYYYMNYIIIPSWPKHQKYEKSTQIMKGIVSVLRDLKPEIYGFLGKESQEENIRDNTKKGI
jgi:hypothetical protein